MGGRVTDALTVFRAEVHGALVAGLAGTIAADQVHPWVPLELATPAVWVDSPIELRTYDAAELIAAVGVLIVVDGADEAQLVALDELEALAWVALETVATAVAAVAVTLNAGGPTLHAVRLEAETPIATRTLCPPTLATAT